MPARTALHTQTRTHAQATSRPDETGRQHQRQDVVDSLTTQHHSKAIPHRRELGQRLGPQVYGLETKKPKPKPKKPRSPVAVTIITITITKPSSAKPGSPSQRVRAT
ncbi:hypothetical protein LA080_015295 [Diaporthe eres]|nr:hypothetical protein LA080_015295 [Diaporthe eres]